MPLQCAAKKFNLKSNRLSRSNGFNYLFGLYARVQVAIPQTGPQMVKTDHNWHILPLLRSETTLVSVNFSLMILLR